MTWSIEGNMVMEVVLVNAFTVDKKGGNPAGVVFDADHLSTAQKLMIAQTVGYSETAFVCADSEADYCVSFFTTTGEVDFCGHATVAVFSTLYQHNKIVPGRYRQRTKAGILAVTINDNGEVLMEQALPQKLGSFSPEQIANMIGLAPYILAQTQLPIEIISTGLSDVIIPVSTGHLDNIQTDDASISRFCEQHNVIGFHVFELCDDDSSLTASCRNFAPLVGISEESATGSACGALACYLSEHLNVNTHYVFEQGRAMNCHSRIFSSVELNNGQITKVKVGGVATLNDHVHIALP